MSGQSCSLDIQLGIKSTIFMICYQLETYLLPCTDDRRCVCIVWRLDNYLLLFLLIHLFLPKSFCSRSRRTAYFLILCGLISKLSVQQVLEYRGPRLFSVLLEDIHVLTRILIRLLNCRCVLCTGQCDIGLWSRLFTTFWLFIRLYTSLCLRLERLKWK